MSETVYGITAHYYPVLENFAPIFVLTPPHSCS